jgi:hypothetical protein
LGQNLVYRRAVEDTCFYIAAAVQLQHDAVAVVNKVV